MPEEPKVLENVSPERRPKGTSAIGTKKKQKTKNRKIDASALEANGASQF